MKIPPAHVLVAHDGQHRLSEYWTANPERRTRYRRRGEYADRLTVLLQRAVAASMRSASPVWSDLSGGLDSSTVTAVAARLLETGDVAPNELAAFSIVASETAAANESAYQAEFLRRYGLRHYTLDADAYPGFSAVPQLSTAHPSKGLLYGALRWAASELLRTHGVSTHLTGRGGDNVFCGMFPPYYLRELLRGLRLRKWWKDTKKWAESGGRSIANLVWHCSVRTPRDLAAGIAGAKVAVPDWLTPRFGETVRAAIHDVWSGGPRLFKSPAREIYYRSIKLAASPPTFVRVGDERSPLLYRPLVEYLLSLPWEQLVTPIMDRVVQRRALLGVVPDVIRLRRSKGVGTDLLLKAMRERWSLLAPLAAGRRLGDLGVAEPRRFEAACLRLRHGVLGHHWPFLAAALSIEMWLASLQDCPSPALLPAGEP